MAIAASHMELIAALICRGQVITLLAENLVNRRVPQAFMRGVEFSQRRLDCAIVASSAGLYGTSSALSDVATE